MITLTYKESRWSNEWTGFSEKMKRTRGMLIVALVTWAIPGFAQDDAGAAATEEITTLAEKGLQSFEWGLLLEAEAGYFKGSSGAQESDLVLATVEFVMDAAVNDWLRGYVGLLWEQYDTEENNLDEAFITMGGAPAYGFYTQVGKYYLPVGNFESVFISDPLTLELAEINKSSAMVGWGNGYVDLNVGAFSGDVNDEVLAVDGGDPTISDFYASVTVAPGGYLQVGAYWLSDLLETDGLLLLGEAVSKEAGYEKDGGVGAFANAFVGPFMLNAEYVSSINGYDLADGRLLPSAFNVEGSFNFLENYLLGLKYEWSNDLYATRPSVGAFADQFPGSGYGAVVKWGFHRNATLGLEYMRLQDMEGAEDGHLVTAQLAFEI